jgi:hypothetical protein
MSADDTWWKWSDPATWADLLDHPANPFNDLEEDPVNQTFVVTARQYWNASIPSAGDQVWIPYWKQVLLDQSTPRLGSVVVEGILVINSSAVVNLTATEIDIRGGKVCHVIVLLTTSDNFDAVHKLCYTL